MNLLFGFVVILSVSVLAWGSPAEQCEGENFEGLRDRIKVTPSCGKKSCRLPKGYNITMELKFKPLRPVKKLVNNVYADIAGIPLPFIGVDNTEACKDVYNAEDNTRAPCPLEAGKEYVYTNYFPIEHFYPEVPLRVHWSLDDGRHKVICFEIPASIVANKKKTK